MMGSFHGIVLCLSFLTLADDEGFDPGLLKLRSEIAHRLIEASKVVGSEKTAGVELARWIYEDYLETMKRSPARLEELKEFLAASRQYEAFLKSSGAVRERIMGVRDDRLKILHTRPPGEAEALYEEALCAILTAYIEEPSIEGKKVRDWLGRAIERGVAVTDAWRIVEPHLDRVFEFERGPSGRWEGDQAEEAFFRSLALAFENEQDFLKALLIYFDTRVRAGGDEQAWWNAVLMNDLLHLVGQAFAKARGMEHESLVRQVKHFRDHLTELGRLNGWWVPDPAMEGAIFQRIDERGVSDEVYSFGYLLPFGTYEIRCDLEMDVTCYVSMEEERSIPFERFKAEYPRQLEKHRAHLAHCDVIFPLPGYGDAGQGWLYVRKEGWSREQIFGLLKEYVEENRDIADNIDFTDILIFIFENERDRNTEAILSDVHGFESSRDPAELIKILTALSSGDARSAEELKIENRSIFNDWVSVVTKVQAGRKGKIQLTFPEDAFSRGYIPSRFRNSLRLSMRGPGEEPVVIRPSYIIRDGE